MDTLQRQKLDAMKELAYGASHEINNPLANISARAQSLLRDEDHPERRRALEAIRQQAMRAHEMISDLMLFARPPQIDAQEFDLCQLIRKVESDLVDECRQRQIRLFVGIPATELVYQGDQRQLTVALTAVVVNAIEAIGREGEINLALRQHSTSNGNGLASITVSDTGPGISEEVLQHLFDPFYSGREAGRGLGFGLSKCWRIVTDHGGDVTAENNTDGGATLTLTLPLPVPASRESA